MRTSAALIAFAAASAVSAQTNVPKYESALNMTISPDSVPLGTRASWCQAQTNSCTSLCGGNTNDNDCSVGQLTYQCTCASNSSAPGLQYYKQTIPFFICDQVFQQCIAANTQSQDGQKACTKNIQDLCGKGDPSKVKSSEGSESSSVASSSTAAATKSAATNAASEVTSTKSGAFAAPTMAPMGKGVAAVAIGLLAYLV